MTRRQGGRRAGRPIGLWLAIQVALWSAALSMPGAAPAIAATHAASQPKVVVIVGPVGTLTDTYRGLGDRAAEAAREWTSNVVTIYSPNATWPAVRGALVGASVVVYLGHGNGWPSPYRDALYGVTQNGLGLNPVAGVDDDAHQYFGEYYLAHDVRLAPGAIVVLGHLCYASGNSEPGGPQPSLDVAQQRADNFAAGWMAAGATAVVAEGHGRPDYYVTAILRGRGTVEGMWRSAPTYHRHVVDTASARTADARLMLDPDKRKSGYFRSLVVRPGSRLADTLAGAPTATSSGPRSNISRVAAGATFGTPGIDGGSVALSEATLSLPVDAATLATLPQNAMVGSRWTPLVVAQPQVLPTDPSAGATPEDPPDVALSEEPPPIDDLISPEAPTAELSVAPAARTKAGLNVPLTMPAQAGLYRLVTTIHDAAGVAYDGETQRLIPALLVRVTPALSASYGLPPLLEASPGARITLGVRVANSGSEAWRHPPAIDELTGARIDADRPPILVARWIGLDDPFAIGQPAASGVAAADIAPGEEAVIDVGLEVPTQPGRYLLIVDVQTSDGTPLASLAVPPGLTRVVVGSVTPAEDGRRPAPGAS